MHAYRYLFRRYSSEVKDCPVVAVCSGQSRAAWSVSVFRRTLATKARLQGKGMMMSGFGQKMNRNFIRCKSFFMFKRYSVKLHNRLYIIHIVHILSLDIVWYCIVGN